MATTYLAIDVGTSWVKLCKVSRGLRGTQLLGRAKAPLTGLHTVQEQAERIGSLVAEHGLSSERTVLGLSARHVLLHPLQFPFSQPQKIRSVLPYELESVVPFDLTHYRFDFCETGRAHKSETRVLAGVMHEQLADEWTAGLQDSGIHPQRLDVDLIGLHRLLLAYPERAENTLVLDLGWSASNLLWRREGKLLAARCLPVGLKHVCKDLSEACPGDDPEPLQEAMQQSGVEGLLDSPAFQGLVRQLRLSLGSADPVHRPESLLVLGGGSLFEPVQQALRQSLGLPLLELDDWPGVDADTAPLGPEYASCLGLMLSKASGLDSFDLRSPEIAEQGRGERWRVHARYALVAGCVLLLALAGSFLLDIAAQKSRLQQLRQEVRATFQEIVPSADAGIRPLQYESILRSRIASLQSGGLSEDVPPVKAVRLLSRISRAVPSDIQLQTNLFTLDGNQVRLSGEAADFKAVDGLKGRLEEVALFSGVEILGANVNQSGQGVRFSLRLTVKNESQGG